MNKDLQARANALAVEVKAKMADTTLTAVQKSSFLDWADAQNADIAAQTKTLNDAVRFRYMADGVPSGFEPGSKDFGKGRAPSLAMDESTLRELHDGLIHRKSFRTEIGTKASDIGGMLPAQLVPGVVGRRHEPARIMQYLPAGPMGAPSIEYLRHNSTTGAAATVAPGTLKPAVTMNIDTILARASKIAATTQVVDENMQDYPAFTQYMGAELGRLVVDVENDQLLNGDGLGTNVLGLRNLSGTLVRPLGTDTALDAVEQAVSDLRTGPAFAEADLVILHPTTFSKLRRTKDSQGRYMLNPDPAATEAESLWGLPAVTTTTCPVGEVVVLDARLAAMVHVRQAMTLEMTPYAGDGFVTNVTTFRCEERVALALPRPAAICRVTGLA